MRFDSYVTAVNGATNPDPVASPATVPNSMVTELKERDPRFQASVSKVFFGLEAPSGETVDISVYALDEETAGAEAADRKWYLIGAIAGLAGGSLEALTDNVVGGGKIYIRVTAETITANRRIGVRAVSQ